MSAHIERLVTSGTFSLDGETFDVDNNVWIVGDDQEVIVIDPAHAPQKIAEAVAGRRVSAILLTHGHDDHIGAVRETAALLQNPPVYLNPEDEMLWKMVFDLDFRHDGDVREGAEFSVAGETLRAITTPGHSPGSTCFYIGSGMYAADIPADVRADLGTEIQTGAQADAEAAVADGGGQPVGLEVAADGTTPVTGSIPVLFSGDTLFKGGPGATGRSYSSFETIIESISTRLFDLPEETVVLTGHGEATTIGAEKPHLNDWIAEHSK